MTKVSITIEIDSAQLAGLTDQRLALAWHVAQANPADIYDHAAGEIVEHVAREIVRRWLRGVSPELWAHQGRHYSQMWLSRFARYRPPEGVDSMREPDRWHEGTWELISPEDKGRGMAEPLETAYKAAVEVLRPFGTSPYGDVALPPERAAAIAVQAALTALGWSAPGDPEPVAGPQTDPAPESGVKP